MYQELHGARIIEDGIVIGLLLIHFRSMDTLAIRRQQSLNFHTLGSKLAGVVLDWWCVGLGMNTSEASTTAKTREDSQRLYCIGRLLDFLGTSLRVAIG
jgi:hypothetical protein